MLSLIHSQGLAIYLLYIDELVFPEKTSMAQMNESAYLSVTAMTQLQDSKNKLSFLVNGYQHSQLWSVVS